MPDAEIQCEIHCLPLPHKDANEFSRFEQFNKICYKLIRNIIILFIQLELLIHRYFCQCSL